MADISPSTPPLSSLPTLTFGLQEDTDRNSQLSFGQRKASPPPEDQEHRPSEQQLLKEGKLGASEFTARLRHVQYGKFRGANACLIVFGVDFAPKNRGWFRFRKAFIEAEVEALSTSTDDREENKPLPDSLEAAETKVNGRADAVNKHDRPLIRTFYPTLIRGHIQTAAETYGIKFEVPIPSPVPSGGFSASWSMTSPRQGAHLIQGRILGLQTRIKWDMNENEITKSGLYEQPTFAFVVTYKENVGFAMGLSMKATTYGGLAVVGKKGGRIQFIRSKDQAGSIAIGTQTWTPGKPKGEEDDDLEKIDLEELTQMNAALLGKQGPGGGYFEGVGRVLGE